MPVLEIKAPLRRQLAEKAADGGQLNLFLTNLIASPRRLLR